MRLSKKRVTAGVVGLLAAGGVAFGASAAYADPGTATNASHTITGATLSSSTTATPKTTVRNPKARRREKRLGEALLRLGHAQLTLRGKDGTWVVHEAQVGRVTSVAGSTVSVRSEDGTTWSWSIASTTNVRIDGAKEPVSDLKVGSEVLVRGVRSGSTNEARGLVAPSSAQIARWEKLARQRHGRVTNPTEKPSISPNPSMDLGPATATS